MDVTRQRSRVAIVCGATLNYREMQNYAPLCRWFDVTAFGSDRGAFDRDRMPFPARTLPDLLERSRTVPFVRRWYFAAASATR